MPSPEARVLVPRAWPVCEEGDRTAKADSAEKRRARGLGCARKAGTKAKEGNRQVKGKIFQCFSPQCELFPRTTFSGVNKSMRKFTKEVETSPEIFIHTWLSFP